jgi:hypothetical protein
MIHLLRHWVEMWLVDLVTNLTKLQRHSRPAVRTKKFVGFDVIDAN